MTVALTRLRPLLIGLVVLLFTAGIAFAGNPSTPADGLSVASEASGKTVPVRAQAEEDEGLDEDLDEDLDEEVDEEAPVAEEQVEAEDEEAGENCAADPTGLSDEALAAVRHGSVVCWAAHQETPEGYANHGEWVSEWAKKNHGHEDTAGEEAEAVASAAAGKARGKSGNH